VTAAARTGGKILNAIGDEDPNRALAGTLLTGERRPSALVEYSRQMALPLDKGGGAR